MKNNKLGNLFLIKAPAGAGKDETLRIFKNLGCIEINTGTMRAPRANPADDGALVFLSPESSSEDLMKKGFNYASTQYGNQYYVSSAEILDHITNGRDCVMIMSKQTTIDALKRNRVIRENMTQIFIYRNGLTLDFLKNLNRKRKNRDLTALEQNEILHRYERAKYLFTRVNEGEVFDKVILNVSNLNFLKEQVSQIYNTTINKNSNSSFRFAPQKIFFIMGAEKDNVSRMLDFTENKLLNHNIEVIHSPDKMCIDNVLNNNKHVMMKGNNFDDVRKIKKQYPNHLVQVGFLFSDSDLNTDSGKKLLIDYAKNIEYIKFTTLSLPFMHCDDVLENMVCSHIDDGSPIIDFSIRHSSSQQLFIPGIVE